MDRSGGGAPVVVKIKQAGEGWKAIKKVAGAEGDAARKRPPPAGTTASAEPAAKKPVVQGAADDSDDEEPTAPQPAGNLVALALARQKAAQAQSRAKAEPEPDAKKAKKKKQVEEELDWGAWEEDWDDEGDDWYGSTQAKKKAAAPSINLDVTYSGVVRKRDPKTGDLLIDCPPVLQAFSLPATLLAKDNSMGARIGSDVVFRVKPRSNGRAPLAKNVVVTGFDDEVEGAEVDESEEDEQDEEEQRRRRQGAGKGGKSGKSAKGAAGAKGALTAKGGKKGAATLPAKGGKAVKGSKGAAAKTGKAARAGGSDDEWW